MDSRELFKRNLCQEVGIKYTHAIGETEDIICLSVERKDTSAKNRIKQWMRNHHWVFANEDIRNIPLIANIPQAGSVRIHTVTYIHGKHKIIINIE